MNMTTSNRLESLGRGLWLLTVVSLFLSTAQGQEITTSYQHSHCHNDPACPYNESTPAGHWAKAIEPDSSYDTVDFNGSGNEVVRRSFNASASLLKSQNTVWSGSRRISVRSYDTDPNAYWSIHTYQYDNKGNITQEEVHSTISTGLPFNSRRTTRTWQSFPNYIWRLQQEDILDLDQSYLETLVSRTSYSYDEFALTNRSGMAGHDTANYGTGFTQRGNPTTAHRWLASESRWIDTKSTYDILGNVVQATDARNNSTTIAYSATFHFAYPTQVTNAKGQSTSTNYSFYTGQVVSVTNPNGYTATPTYDSLNRTRRIDNPDGSYLRASYDLTANNISTTVYQSIASGRESASTTILDGIGRQKQKRIRSPEGDSYIDTVYYACDCAGKIAKVSNPYRTGETKYWTETQYDALGRPVKIIPPDGTPSSNYTSYSYNMAAATTTVTDPAGKIKRYHYDALGRIWKVVEPDGTGQLTQETTYNYLPTTGQNKLIITQGVQTRTFNYDTLGRLTSETHPENGTTSYTYDDNGNALAKTDTRGWTANLSYDQINRLTGKTYTGDGGVTPAVALAYDTASNGIGKLASWTSGSHSGSSSYDNMGRSISEQRTIGGLSYTAQLAYNLGGQVTTTTFPNNWTFTNDYDAGGSLEAITTNFTGTVLNNVDRNAAGAWTQVAYANGVNNTRSYSSTLQLSTLQVTGPGGTYLDYSYSYNAGVSNNGRIAGITDNADTTKSVSYTYDEVNRLKTAETNGTQWGLTWTYDRYGNRTAQSATKGAPPTNSLNVDSATNRVTGWSYDAAGNVTNDGRNTYAYDAENRIISINGGATTYSYDAFGGRILKVTAGTTVRYYFGLAENTNGAWTKLFISTPAGVIEWDNGTMVYRSNDHLGSPRVMTAASGAVLGRTDLYPYGEVWSETGTGTKYKMTEKERDVETGNDFFGVRYYFNGSGRWLGVDPVLGNLYDPQRMNRYSYVLNDPINYTDADGAEPIFRTHVIGYLPFVPVSPQMPTGGNRARVWDAGTPEHLSPEAPVSTWGPYNLDLYDECAAYAWQNGAVVIPPLQATSWILAAYTEYGTDPAILGTIWSVESGFDTGNPVYENKDDETGEVKSRDYGPLQINDVRLNDPVWNRRYNPYKADLRKQPSFNSFDAGARDIADHGGRVGGDVMDAARRWHRPGESADDFAKSKYGQRVSQRYPGLKIFFDCLRGIRD